VNKKNENGGKHLKEQQSSRKRTTSACPADAAAPRTIIYLGSQNFAMYRRLIRPNMVWGWWVEEVANQLQVFYQDFAAGKRPKLALMAPPQHGKSWSVTDFISWVAGRNRVR
jgi:hypothetical protein